MLRNRFYRSIVTPRPAHLLLAALFVLPLIWGCGGGGGGPSEPPAEPSTAGEYVTRGWARFEQQNFDGALADFNEAITLDAALGEAHAGLGWTRLSLATSSISMQAAGTSLDAAISHGETGAYVLAGRAAAYLGSGPANLAGAATQAEAALTAAPGFSFAHRPTFTHQDLRLIVAFAKAGQGDYAGALAAADQVQASGIDTGNEATWQVGGVTYPLVDMAILAHLQLVSGQFSG